MSLVPALDATFARAVPAFFPPPVQARIAVAAAALPAFATEFFGFEIHFGQKRGSDFLVCVDAGLQAEALVEGLRRAPPSSDPIWPRLAAFCDDWTKPRRNGDRPVPGAPAGSWRDLIHNLWLEFDLAEHTECEPLLRPSLFLGTHHLTAGSDPACLDAVCLALDELEGALPSAERRQALKRAMALLPPGGALFQIGLMLSRSDKRVRICVKGLGAVEAVAYLDRLGYPCSTELEAIATTAAGACHEIRLAFDAAADTVSGRIGIECYPNGDGGAERWFDLCDMVRERGLLAPADAEALTGWIALIHQRLVDPAASAWFATHPARASATAEGAIHRWIHHLKLTLDLREGTTLKAYLAAQPCWFEPREFADLIKHRRPVSRGEVPVASAAG